MVWTDKDIELLKENYSDGDWKELINTLNRKKQDIMSEASKLGLKRNSVKFALWSKDEDAVIREHYNNMRIKDIHSKYLPNRSVLAISARAQFLGVISRKKWSEEEKKKLTDCYDKMKVENIVKIFPGRTRNSIIGMAVKLKLENPYNKTYTLEDNEYIATHYLSMTDAEIGVVLGRARQSIKEHRRQIGLKRPKPQSNYTDINDFLRRNNKKWKWDSMHDCHFQCVITGGRFDAIHHLYGMNMIVEETLYEIGMSPNININQESDNTKKMLLDAFQKEQSKYPLGVCLCEKYHIGFHNKYGYGYNTPEQFSEYISSLTHENDIA